MGAIHVQLALTEYLFYYLFIIFHIFLHTLQKYIAITDVFSDTRYLFSDILKKHTGSVSYITGINNVLCITFMHNVRYKMSVCHQERQKLTSVLKRDDRVHFIHMVWTVPKYSGEVIFVGRIVQLYLLAESSILGEGIHHSFVIHNLQEKGGNNAL